MMQVKVWYHAAFADLTGVEEETLQAEQLTLGELLDLLVSRYGEPFTDLLFDPRRGDIRAGMTVLVNSRLAPRDTRLRHGDEVVFLIPLAGG